MSRRALVTTSLFGIFAQVALAAYYLGANQNFLYVGGGGTNKTIDSTHTFSFYVNVAAGQSLTLYGGNFTINGGNAPTDDIYFVLYGCNYACGTPIGSARLNKTSAPTTFAATNFVFTSGGVYYTGSNARPVTLSAGSYFAMLYSNTGTSGAAQYGFKASAASIGDGTNNVSTSIATSTTNSQSAAQLSLLKTVSSTSSLINTNFTYTVGIGNVGSAISPTPVYFYDQLPASVSVSAAGVGTGTASASCTPLNTAGALLTCTVGVTGGIPSGGSPANYTITLTASGTSAGTQTNYVYADTATQDGSQSPVPTSTTITTCTSSNCANVSNTLLLTPTLTVTNTPQTYTGSAIAATVTCSSGGTVSNVLYNASSTVPATAGTYAITADCTATGNYTSLTGASASNSFVISQATPTLTVTNSPQVYNGSGRNATVSCTAGGTVSNIKYGGSTTVPINAGTYAITADCASTTNYTAVTGASAGNFVISQATPTLTVTNSPQTYTGSAIAATVSCSASGTVSNIRYGGSTTVPTNAGTYTITADCASTTNYAAVIQGSAGSFVINNATPTLTVTNTPQTYTGSAIAATVTCSSTGTVSNVLYGGSSTVPTNIGTYAITANCASTTNYTALTGASAGNFVIAAATPTLTITNTPQTYTGSTIAATVTCSSGGTVSNILYGGNSTAPTNAGTYAVTANCAANGNYAAVTGGSAGNFVISQATPTLTVTNTPQTYTGSAIAATVTCSSTGTVSNVLYGGSSNAPAGAGTYAITANCSANGNYAAVTGASAGSFVINQATPTLTVTNSPQTYNGSAIAAAVTCSSGGTVSNVKYNSSSTVPINVGTYAITADCAVTANFTALSGASAGNFAIVGATPTLSVTNTPQTYNGSAIAAAVTCSSGGTVSNVKYNASSTVPTNIGTYAITANCAANGNYAAVAGASAGSFVINGAVPEVSVTNSPQTYTGNPIAAVVTCFSGGTVSNILYNGLSTVPTSSGTYAVTADCTANGNYTSVTGGQAGNFVITNLQVPTLTITNTPQTYNGSPIAATVTCSSGGTVSNIEYNGLGTTPTNAGSYVITADCAATGNYSSLTGTSAGNFVINQIAPTASVTNSPQTYTGNPIAANVTCLGGGAVSSIKYDSNSATPTTVGTYAVTANCASSTNYTAATGVSAGSFTISNATPTLTITNTPQTYTGSAIAATVTCFSGGTVTNIKYGGNTAQPINVGTYAVTADCAAVPNYNSLTGASAGSFVISAATPTLTITNTPRTYTGNPIAATVTCSSGGSVTNIKYGGTSTTPTDAATYAITADCAATSNYTALTGSSAGNFVINAATPTLTVTNTPQTYTGSPIAATVTCSSSGTVSNIKYGGDSTVPTNVGTYAITADCGAITNYTAPTGASAGNFVISPATPTLSVSNTPQTYTGSPIAATVTCSGGGAVTNIKYGGNSNIPTTAGTYAITADCASTSNYNAATSASAGNFVISPATPTLTVTNTPQTFTGNPIAATVTCSGGGTVSNIQYNNSSTVPTNAGTYTITADCASSTNYSAATGASAGNFVISAGTATLTVTNTPQTYTGSPIAATVTCSSGGAVSNVRYNNSTTVPTNVGTYTITADCAANGNYAALSGVSAGTFVITGGGATLSITNTPQTYTGSPIAATVTCSSGGAVTNIRYNGSSTVPTNAGSYTITADCAAIGNYAALTGTSAGAFVISGATPTLSVTNTPQIYTGNPIAATVTCSSSGAVSNVKYSGSSTVPTNVGTYAITADCAANGNYAALTGASAGNFVISGGAVTLSVTNTPQTYSGSPIAAIVNCSSGGTASNILYNNSSTVPTNAGTYAITANCAANGNYSALTGASAGNFVITPATPTLTILNSPQVYNGGPIAAEVNCSSGGAVTNIRYGGSSTLPTNAGTYPITADCAANANQSEVVAAPSGNYTAVLNVSVGNFVILVATPTRSITNSPQVFTGGPLAVALICSGGGAVSNVRYNGSTTVPTSAGTYVITADCAASANYAAVTGASFGSFVIIAPVGTPIRITDLLTLAGLLGLVGLIALRKTSAA